MRQVDEVKQVYAQLLQRFIHWAQGEQNIRAVIQVGSRVRQDPPADEWADVDLMLYLTQPDAYLRDQSWLPRIAPVWFAIDSRTVGGDPELLVMFEGGYSVDFVMCPVLALDWLRDHAPEDRVFERGGRVLLDRDGVAAQVIAHLPRRPTRRPPTAAEFEQVCTSFAYASVYIARQIRRGELWLAQNRDAIQKDFLLRMLEWHAGVTSNWQRDTWYSGRFLEEWVDMRALADIPHIFGRYHPANASAALLASVRLFSWVARETAVGLNLPYPTKTEERTLMLVEEALGVLVAD